MLRSAIVQDWFFAPGGSEEVAIALARMIPESDVYTSFAEPAYGSRLAGHRVHTWPIQRLVGPTRRYRSFLPLYPLWFGRLDLRRYDLVLSSSSAFAHAVRTKSTATHVAYVHTPMRYAYELGTYLDGSTLQLPSRLAARALAGPLRRWNRAASRRPDVLIANSTAVRDRIRLRWNRDAEVIHPPVEVDSIAVSAEDDGFLLVAARLLAYRRIDLLVDVATCLGRELVVAGDGPERRRLEQEAGPTVRFVGRVHRAELLDLLARCHAYVVPGEEDFGIAPVEAMAAGKPVVAYRAGGAVETVIDGHSGVFFHEQTPDALAAAIEQLDTLEFDPAVIRANAERFAPEVFRAKFVDLFRRLGVDPSLYRS